MSIKRLVRRHGLQAEWDSDDPLIWEGEVAWATDTGVFKVGDGESTWSQLNPIGAAGTQGGSGYVKRDGAGTFTNTEPGSSAFGYANEQGAYKGVIEATGRGGLAFGYAYTYAGAGSIAAGAASLAFGYAYGGPIAASSYSFAGGSVFEGSIQATGNGSFAFGAAFGYDIVASANNSFQFGQGTNDVPNSLQVGEGIRIHGPSATPGSPANGDIWENSGNVYIRSGGVTVTIS